MSIGRIAPPPSFLWSVNSTRGLFTGEQKAALVDRMEQIAERVGGPATKVEFSYDVGSVIAKISAKPDPDMVERARQRAEDATSRGWHGLLAGALLFWHGIGPAGRAELQSRLADGYLRAELSDATGKMQSQFKKMLADCNGLGSIVERTLA